MLVKLSDKMISIKQIGDKCIIRECITKSDGTILECVTKIISVHVDDIEQLAHALMRYCGPDDLLTPLQKAVEGA